MGALIDALHAQSIRVILWATSMIDTDSSNYAEAAGLGFFIRDGLNQTTADPIKWWHGNGILLDYSNPKALPWWNSQLDLVLNLSVDGFKTDGTDPFIMEYITPFSDAGPITYREYADAYYGSFFNYSRSKNPDALIMSRPVDSYPIIGDLSAYLQFSPRYAVFSGWVGDQDPTFPGLKDALGNMIHSAWLRYVGFGSDIGGYRTGPGALGRTGELLLRWASVGAFSSLMENGGDKEHRPWAFDAPGSTFHVDAYRALVALHYELEPYLLTTGAQAWETNQSIMRPIMPEPADPLGIIGDNNLTTYDYLLGPDYYVSPVLENGTTTQAVSFPESQTGWFDVFNRTAVYSGSTNVTVPAPLGRIPAFGRRAALLPLHVSTPSAGNGDEASADAVTLLVHTPRCDGTAVRIELRDSKARGSAASYTCRESSPGSGAWTFELGVSPLGRDVIVLLRGVRPASGSVLQAVVAAASGPAAHCRVRNVAHPVLGPAAVAHAPPARPLPPLRDGDAAVGCSAQLSAADVNAAGEPVTTGGVGEVLLRRIPADTGVEVTISGLSFV